MTCEEHHIESENCMVCGMSVVWVVKSIQMGMPQKCYIHRHKGGKIVKLKPEDLG